jgi:hypothetical protein
MEIPGLLEDTLNLAGRAVSARAHSAAMNMVDKKEAFRSAAAPASAAAAGFRAVEAEGFTAVAVEAEAVGAGAGTDDRTFRNGEKPDAANESQSY